MQNIVRSCVAVVVPLVLAACVASTPQATTTPPPPPPTGGGTNVVVAGAAPAAGVFVINNQTAGTICYAMISPASDPNWGPDQLGANVIASGASYSWNAGVGVWDVMLQDCEHNTVLERRNLDINGGGTVLTVVPGN